MLNYAFISLLAIKLVKRGGKKLFAKYRYDSNLILPTSYIYDPTYTKIETNGEI